MDTNLNIHFGSYRQQSNYSNVKLNNQHIFKLQRDISSWFLFWGKRGLKTTQINHETSENRPCVLWRQCLPRLYFLDTSSSKNTSVLSGAMHGVQQTRHPQEAVGRGTALTDTLSLGSMPQWPWDKRHVVEEWVYPRWDWHEQCLEPKNVWMPKYLLSRRERQMPDLNVRSTWVEISVLCLLWKDH